MELADRLDRATAALRCHFGFAAFRPMQRRVVQSVLAGRDTLAVLPTGGGKSVCFQVPALTLDGLTVVVSPLISLMQDQVSAARSRGLLATHLSGDLTPEDVERALCSASSGALQLLYTSPERLPRLAGQLAARRVRTSLLAVDEAHCISEWGHDFRPAFRRIAEARSTLGSPPVVALTGSATPDVRQDIIGSLGLGAKRGRVDLHLDSFDRANLAFAVLAVRREPDRIRLLRQLLRAERGLAIVYAPTRRMTETLALAIRHGGRPAVAYHAGLGREIRDLRLRAFLRGETATVVATSAFGMGIDKPDVRLVVHWAMPPTPEAYYQEAGRAGRDGAAARCVLLAGHADAQLHRRQLDVTFPARKLLERIWSGNTTGVAKAVVLSAERLKEEIAEAGPAAWKRINCRKKVALRRIAAMAHYARTSRCRRAALIGWFGERLKGCSGCDNC
jgi:ATP-dependent DNA helicase RecQ